MNNVYGNNIKLRIFGGSHDEIIGMDVVRDDTGETVGVVTDVTPYPAHNVYTVRGSRGEFMIPAVPEVFIKSADADANRLVVHLLEGMDGDEI